MEGKNKKEDKSMENALSLMDHSEEWTEEDIQVAIKDEECIQACLDILDCRVVMHQENSSCIPDTEMEWQKFRQKHSSRPKVYWMALGFSIGMVASIFLLLAFSWLTNIEDFSEDSIVHFAAIDESVQYVTLQTTDGVQLSLNDTLCNEKLNDIGAALIQTDSARLEYSTLSEHIENHILTTPRGKTFEVVLSDGSKVWLNADSRLEYPSRFIGEKRMVKLYGEAYFQIAQDDQHPFIVDAEGLQTVVLGTEFNIRSYKNTLPHVTLIKGKVKLCDTIGRQCVMLSPGENALLSDDGSFVLKEVDVDKYIYWRDGYFYYDNMSLADIMQDIGRWYNINVIFENPKAMDYKLRYFCKHDEGIEKAIERLRCLKKANVKFENNTVFIR